MCSITKHYNYITSKGSPPKTVSILYEYCLDKLDNRGYKEAEITIDLSSLTKSLIGYFNNAYINHVPANSTRSVSRTVLNRPFCCCDNRCV